MLSVVPGPFAKCRAVGNMACAGIAGQKAHVVSDLRGSSLQLPWSLTPGADVNKPRLAAPGACLAPGLDTRRGDALLGMVSPRTTREKGTRMGLT